MPDRETVESAAISTREPTLKSAAWLFASACLFALAFVPQLYGVTVWFALVPAFLAARTARLSRLFWLAWAAGYVAMLAVFYWVMIVTWEGGLLLPIYLGLYWPVFFVAVEVLKRRLNVPRVVSAIALWPILEFARGWLMTGLPWFYLGHALYRWPRLIQSADLGGALLVSAVVVFVNALLAEALAADASAPRRRFAVAAAAAVFAANLAYGVWRFARVSETAGPTVALVQPNVPQDIKIMQTDEDAARIFKDLRRMTLGDKARRADIIFWPETIMPGLVGVEDYVPARGLTNEERLDELSLQGLVTPAQRTEILRLCKSGVDFQTALERGGDPRLLPHLTAYSLLSSTSKIAGKPLVAGAIWAVVGPDGDHVERTYNRAYSFDASGREAAWYDKVHLVPFGEFIPFRDSLPAVSKFIGAMMPVRPVVYPGADFEVFTVGPDKLGPAICFEDTFSYIGRQYRRRGVDILVNLTNDGWFGGSFELEAHLANALFRAVETRMAVVRSANTGVSAVVSPKGVVVARLADGRGRDREVEGLLVANVPVSKTKTLYAALGDRWLFLPAALLAASVLVSRRRRC